MESLMNLRMTYPQFLKYILPSILSAAAISFFTTIDGFFVSRYVGPDPLAAINIVIPYCCLVYAISLMLASGAGAYVSIRMGEGKHQEARQLFSYIVTAMCIIGGIVLTALSMVFMRPVAILLGATGQMLEDCVTYGMIVQLALTAYILQYAFQSFCVTAEKPNLSLTMMVAAGVCNIALDALFVAAFRWGLVGAAVATAIAQIIGAVIPIIYFARPNDSLLRLGKCRFDGKALLRTCTNGFSELLGNVSMSLMSKLYNLQLLAYAGEDGIAAFGVIMYVNFTFISVYIGFAIGTAPVIGFNHGADNRTELKSLMRKCLILLAAFSTVMTLLAEIMARPLSTIFTGYDPQLLEMTVRGFRIYSISYLLTGFNMFSSSLFTALNNGFISAVLSFFRALVCQLAAILILPMLWELDGIWWSNVAAEIGALAVAAFFVIKYRKRYHYL